MGFSRRTLRFGMVLLLVLVGITSTGHAARAESPSIVVIVPADTARFQLIHTAFLLNLEKMNPGAGKSTVTVLTPGSDHQALRNSVRKAVALAPDVTVVYGTRAAIAAKQEVTAGPLLFADVFDPVTMGLVPAPDRGGETMTGVCGHAPIQTLLRALQQILGTSRLVLPVEAGDPAAAIQAAALRKGACREEAAADAGASPPGQLCWLEIVPTDMPAPEDAVKTLKAAGGDFDALYLGDLLPTDRHAAALFAYAAEAGLPVISPLAGAAEDGALLALEADPAEQGELLADLAGRLLAGASTAEIPPASPRRVALVVNLKVARQLDIEVPFSLLLQTKRLIR